MVMQALNKKLWRDLWIMKMQSISIAVILIGGVGALLSSWSSYQSLTKSRDHFYSNYSFADVFSEFKQAPVSHVSLLQKIPGIETIEGRIVIEGIANLPHQAEPAVTKIISIPSGAQPLLNRLYLRQGRLPMEGAETEVMVHEAFAKAHKLRPGDHFQVLIEGQQETVRVVGTAISPEYVYALGSSVPLPDDKHFGVLWMSYPTLSRLAKQQDAINSIVAKLDPQSSTALIKDRLDQYLKKYGGMGAYARDQQISSMLVENEIAEQRGTGIILPLIFFSVAAFLIHVIFSRIVTLNRPQIATLKAIGFSNWEISYHYLKLVVLMTMVGTLPGILVGAMLAKYISNIYLDFFHFPELRFSLSYSALAIGFLSGVVPGILGAIQSIRTVFKLVPAEAMRPPAPTLFQKTFFDKLFSKKIISPKAKMIIRNLFHRPDRLMMIVFGMSAATGIIVTSFAFNDMMNELLDVQFQRVQREDISLGFIRPISENGLQELKKMDGIIAVEGYREVPVRIRYLNHKKELSLTGRPENNQMRQAIDINRNKIDLPEDGLVLGRFFNKQWGLTTGDLVEIEILEGRQQKHLLRVAAFTDEMIGLSAGMKIESLWKLLGEEGGYNHVMIKSDAQKINQLYGHFKTTPAIRSVVLKGATYRGFKDTMGSVMEVSTTILVTFSIAIAFGVIYNSIRVNFSERSWEMASLRVMGFEKQDVFTLVFVEVALQVIFCILPGCIFGYWFTRLSLQGIHTENFSFPVVIYTKTYLKASLVVLLSLVASSVVVYRMIDKLSLVEALKSRE